MPKHPQSASQLFDEMIPAALAANPGKAKAVAEAIYKFAISGDGGGTWYLDIKSTPPTCSQQAPSAKPDCTIEIASTDFNALLEQPALAMQLYFRGKLRVTGDPILTTKLQKLFALVD